MAKINGKEENVGRITISELLKQKEFNEKVVVVEINEEIVPKNEYESYRITEEDVVEVVSFVGGG